MEPVRSPCKICSGTCYDIESLGDLLQTILGHGYPVMAIKGILGCDWLRMFHG